MSERERDTLVSIDNILSGIQSMMSDVATGKLNVAVIQPACELAAEKALEARKLLAKSIKDTPDGS